MTQASRCSVAAVMRPHAQKTNGASAARARAWLVAPAGTYHARHWVLCPHTYVRRACRAGHATFCPAIEHHACMPARAGEKCWTLCGDDFNSSTADVLCRMAGSVSGSPGPLSAIAWGIGYTQVSRRSINWDPIDTRAYACTGRPHSHQWRHECPGLANDEHVRYCWPAAAVMCAAAWPKQQGGVHRVAWVV